MPGFTKEVQDKVYSTYAELIGLLNASKLPGLASWTTGFRRRNS